MSCKGMLSVVGFEQNQQVPSQMKTLCKGQKTQQNKNKTKTKDDQTGFLT